MHPDLLFEAKGTYFLHTTVNRRLGLGHLELQRTTSPNKEGIMGDSGRPKLMGIPTFLKVKIKKK